MCRDSPVLSVASVLDGGRHRQIRGEAINLQGRVNCAAVCLQSTELVCFSDSMWNSSHAVGEKD